jgi:hypothetical protein
METFSYITKAGLQYQLESGSYYTFKMLRCVYHASQTLKIQYITGKFVVNLRHNAMYVSDCKLFDAKTRQWVVESSNIYLNKSKMNKNREPTVVLSVLTPSVAALLTDF